MRLFRMPINPVLALAACLAASCALAEDSSKTFNIGTLVDMTGPYSALAGPGVVTAVKMAVEDFGGSVLGKPIKVLSADTLVKPDVAASKAREWFDRDGVNMILEGSDSAVAVALQKLAAANKKVTFLFAGTTAVNNAECTRYGIQYAWNTYAMASGTGRAIVKEGGDSWYFLTSDYTFGKALEADTTNVVQKMGARWSAR